MMVYGKWAFDWGVMKGDGVNIPDVPIVGRYPIDLVKEYNFRAYSYIKVCRQNAKTWEKEYAESVAAFDEAIRWHETGKAPTDHAAWMSAVDIMEHVRSGYKGKLLLKPTVELLEAYLQCAIEHALQNTFDPSTSHIRAVEFLNRLSPKNEAA